MTARQTNGLHLPSLSIQNFRGVHGLSIERLGRVTLLGGRNGIGKTTILEAVQVYAARGQPRVLSQVLSQREEFSSLFDDERIPVSPWDYTALFYGRVPSWEQVVAIGPTSQPTEFEMQLCPLGSLTEDQQERFTEILMDGDWKFLRVKFKGRETAVLPMPVESDLRTTQLWRQYTRSRHHSLLEYERAGILNCECLGPGITDNEKLARFWDSVALTAEEDLSLQALRMVSSDIERIAVVGDGTSRFSGAGRRVLVKLRSHPAPVPLKSLGDGAARLFATGLALANSRDGFLVIDEADNGIHYSLERSFWRMVLEVSRACNVQVLATTHSSDCVAGFARAAAEFQDVESVYLRLEPRGDQLRSVEYDKQDMKIVAEQGIEVR